MFIYLKRKKEKNYIPKRLNMVILACGLIDNFKIFHQSIIDIQYYIITVVQYSES